jgi:hypothetical protein
MIFTKISKIPAYFFMAVLLLVSRTGFTEEAAWYQVEIIIFSYPKADTSFEKWPDDPGKPDYSKIINILESEDYYPYDGEYQKALTLVPSDIRDKVPPLYTQLPKDSLTLVEDAKKIRWSRARKLLLHSSWIQPVYDRKNAPAIQFTLGDQYTVTKPLIAPVAATSTPQPAPAAATPSTNTIPGVKPDASRDPNSPGATTPAAPAAALPPTGVDVFISETQHEVEGTITISVSRYLHVYTDFLAHRPEVVADKQDPTKTQTVIKTYRFKDHRRMRSKELHYIDNPLFGILIYFTPYKLPENKIESSS